MPTDWRSPTTSTLARIGDARARQFWDPHHLVAQELKRDFAADSVPLAGHTSSGFYWDLAVLYPANARWNTNLPAPLFADGPVADVADQLDAKLRGLALPQNSSNSPCLDCAHPSVEGSSLPRARQ